MSFGKYNSHKGFMIIYTAINNVHLVFIPFHQNYKKKYQSISPRDFLSELWK